MVTPVWADFVSGSLTSTLSAISAGATQTMSSEGLRSLPSVVDGVSRSKLVLDPFGVQGSPELVYVTSHAASANTAIIQRISGQALRQHAASESWVHGPTAEDFSEFQTQLDNQFHTSVYTAAGQLLGSTAAATPSPVSVGTEYYALTSQSAQATKVGYRAIPFVVTSSTRPTSANGQYVGMHIFETDTLHTLVCTVVGTPGTWQYVDTPPGTIALTGAASLPVGWVWCDGTAYNASVGTAYTALFAALANQFGGTNNTNFTVPDLRSKFVYGWDTTTATAKTNAGARGYTAGASTKTLIEGNLPTHTHSIATHLHTMAHDHSSFTSSSDGSHRHDFGGVSTSSGLIVPMKTLGTERLDSGGNATPITFTNMDAGGTHSHTVNVPSFSGNTGTGGTTVTGSGNGTSAAFDIMPPYITLGYMIRL